MSSVLNNIQHTKDDCHANDMITVSGGLQCGNCLARTKIKWYPCKGERAIFGGPCKMETMYPDSYCGPCRMLHNIPWNQIDKTE